MVGPGVKLRLSKNLKIRVLSAVCILPIPMIAVWNGSWIFSSFVGLLAIFLMYEWNKLIGLCRIGALSYGTPLLMGMSIVLFYSPWVGAGLFCLLATTFFNLILGIRGNCNKIFSLWGSIYIFLPCASIIWIREYPAGGLELMLWLVITVCATDTGAYFLGRMVGGPKLAPKISPGKTWAGLLGGVICASLFGTLFAIMWFDFLVLPSLWEWGLMAVLIAGTAQMGDLGESWLKRSIGVKDSGTIIPGHGGLLDRLDGFMLSAPVLSVLILSINLK